MAEHLTVSFVTPDRQVEKGEVEMVTAPSALGEVGILPNHRALLADLVPGVVELRHDGGKVDRFAVSGGFLEVDRNHVVLLVETAERPGEIDIERAERALSEAESTIRRLPPSDPDFENSLARAERARVRLWIAGRV